MNLGASALVIVDAQQGFDDPWWGPRNNPDADANIAALDKAYAAEGLSRIYVQHDSANPDSPLHPANPGHQLKSYLDSEPQLRIAKTVNSSFHGSPDLDAWLKQRKLSELVICGITTNHCCETTARVGGNLGYDVLFVADATYTFDRTGPDGTTMTADELTRATCTNLHGEFATVVATADVVRALAR
ncbi:cysteine hydrolase family protein [Antrihabitans cavernicola]|uniref:Cysteine hydrolase n=1 Tax=Antrihabitans cavernicola TaxID=2495913 RepID=A0A5A7SG62_9NOCA|nr:cysteine hydrolase family protein [Spelaeibacter cavernicola]KAA0024564.1 cysteine hydrolase [Spelaeibacter cavernicola]